MDVRGGDSTGDQCLVVRTIFASCALSYGPIPHVTYDFSPPATVSDGPLVLSIHPNSVGVAFVSYISPLGTSGRPEIKSREALRRRGDENSGRAYVLHTPFYRLYQGIRFLWE